MLMTGRRWWVAALLSALGWPAHAQQAPHWRVCIPELVAPPYLYNDDSRPGIAERIVIDAAKEAGLVVSLVRLPPRRCRAAIEGNEADAVLVSPAAEVRQRYLFPARADAIDASLRVASFSFVWIKRKDSPYSWDGRRLAGGTASPITVGTRVSARVALESLRSMGVEVDDSALSTRQLLLKVAAKRVDLGVAVQEEVQYLMDDPAMDSLVVLPRPLVRTELYLAIPVTTPPSRRREVQAWWSAIGRVRGKAEYNVR
ncbi:hypothetical protein [Roseateles sp.]|uniref:hypothetical protein n=1 Tax=Roseateles sp. TaxID=1971397 RepID=UPI0039EA8290